MEIFRHENEWKTEEEKAKILFRLCRYRFTQIAVDPQIKTPGGKTYDVIFVGTGELAIEQR